jgi:hypothetical protein
VDEAVPLMEALELAAPRYNLEFISGRRLGADGALVLVKTAGGYRKIEAIVELSGNREADDDALYARLVEVMAETA